MLNLHFFCGAEKAPVQQNGQVSVGHQKRMKTIVLILIVAAASLTAFLAGRLTGAYSPNAFAKLDDFVEQMAEVNSNGTYQTVLECELYISLLQELERGSNEQAKQRLIEELGHIYYNYTYEDERYMNPSELEQVLVNIDNLSNESEVFSSVRKYDPNDSE